MNDAVGLAVFVKTPGLSPVKTRLAASIGQVAAEDFYRRSLAAIECCMKDLRTSGICHPYWAVAEEDALAHELWRKHSTIFQGEGSLGLRLARVFEDLSLRHKHVMAIGGDSPQISLSTIKAAIHQLKAHTKPAHVVGRCHDGGFYLVGSNYWITAEVWTKVAYSVETTADELIALLWPSGPIHELGSLSDVDTYSDLVVMAEELGNGSKVTPAQQKLLRWVEKVLSE